MNSYVTCRGCARHLKRVETRCPFCSATRIAISRGGDEAVTCGSRTSRGQWLLLAMVGSALATACSQDGSSTSGVVSCYSSPGIVQDTGCDLETSYCSDGYCTPLNEACRGHGNCECLTSTCHEKIDTCTSDGAGGIDFSCYSSQGCYGSPPARLERLAPSGSLSAA